MLVQKNRRMLEIPMNDAALSVVNGWHGLRKCGYVFYNPETGRAVERPLLNKACRKAGLTE